ncbi:MAG: hypothetical protein LBB89_00605 [Treponema sp.]|nr:hypothetical protein [Treponema sp.]
MTKAEWRIKDFSSGIKKLSNHSRNYIRQLTHVLFLVEQPPVYPVPEKKNLNQKRKTARMG